MALSEIGYSPPKSTVTHDRHVPFRIKTDKETNNEGEYPTSEHTQNIYKYGYNFYPSIISYYIPNIINHHTMVDILT